MCLWIVFLVALGLFQEVLLSSPVGIDFSGKDCSSLIHKGPNTENDVGTEETVAISKLADVFLLYVRKKAKTEGYDPLKLPNRSVAYGIQLYDGSAVGLSELQRLEDTLLSTRNDTVTLTIALQLTNARVFYKWEKVVLFVSLQGTMRVTVKKIVIVIQLLQKINAGEHPQLAKYSVPEVGELVVEFSGLGPFNSKLRSKIKKEASKALSDMLHKEVPDIIIKHLKKISL